MNHQTSYTFQEITSQPSGWAEGLEVVRRQRARLEQLGRAGYDQVLYTGCGSTYYLSQAVAALLQDLTGRRCLALPASELLLYPRQAYPAGAGQTLLLVSSRSGKTTETLRAVEAFRQAGQGQVIVVTIDPDAPLVGLADICLAIPGAQEIGVAQTKSFAAMYVAHTAICAIFAGREELFNAAGGLAPLGEWLLQEYGAVAERLGLDRSLADFFYLGSGPRYGLACEASLKLKEISLSSSEPFHFLEFRHGPVARIEPETLVVGLLSDASRLYEEPVLQEVRELGGRTLSLAEAGADVSFQSGLPEPLRGVLYLPVLHLLAYYRAVAAGLNPDKLKNLPPFIEFDWPEQG
jgi:glucosamine--fructose-6-phosphate aminotransferase (isomerizing)